MFYGVCYVIFMISLSPSQAMCSLKEKHINTVHSMEDLDSFNLCQE